ncbi:hypothetical protein DN069_33405 [Streptacidiphilus pinicola]|uniref:DUF6234 domain-containing protein n=1 Tax=Streptacidiphilus pinicola TaxID=2219663 RepID=A0A2X0IUP6_9ACTN|nr:hypothetical protein DN069_33405 [Streptacidiphilus pinicola]
MDIPTAVALFIVEGLLYVASEFMAVIGAAFSEPSAELDAAFRAGLDRTWWLLIAAVAFAVLAGFLRAPVVVVSQVLAAVILAVLLGLAYRSYDEAHPPPPTPGPTTAYEPCYSGSHGPSCR